MIKFIEVKNKIVFIKILLLCDVYKNRYIEVVFAIFLKLN